MNPYVLDITDLADHSVEIASDDQPSLAVIRDEVKLHGYEVSDIKAASGRFSFCAKSDEPEKVREFLMGLSDVEVSS